MTPPSSLSPWISYFSPPTALLMGKASELFNSDLGLLVIIYPRLWVYHQTAQKLSSHGSGTFPDLKWKVEEKLP